MVIFFFFFKQKTAYEMRISDWSSDVCSSDLLPAVVLAEPVERKFLKALKHSDIEALEFPAQLDEGVEEGWITAAERVQLEQLREMTLDAITVDDFEPWVLRGAQHP